VKPCYNLKNIDQQTNKVYPNQEAMSKKVYVGQSKIAGAGRGVFAAADLKKNAVIEICPVITMGAKDADLCMKTQLKDYVYEYDNTGCMLALGYGSLYNHHVKPNARYEMAESEGDHPGMPELYIVALKPIAKDEEIYINYGKHFDEQFSK
jgi:hypothetical protein